MEKIINLERFFGHLIRKDVLLEEINGCLKNLNKFIEQKSGVSNVFSASMSGGFVKVGYKNNPKADHKGFHNNLALQYDEITNLAVFQFIIFDGNKEWGCYDDIPMYGAPEENKNAGFHFTLDGTKYHYQLFIKK